MDYFVVFVARFSYLVYLIVIPASEEPIPADVPYSSSIELFVAFKIAFLSFCSFDHQNNNKKK